MSPTCRCHCPSWQIALGLAVASYIRGSLNEPIAAVPDQIPASCHCKLYVNFSTWECEAAAMNVARDAQRHSDPFIGTSTSPHHGNGDTAPFAGSEFAGCYTLIDVRVLDPLLVVPPASMSNTRESTLGYQALTRYLGEQKYAFLCPSPETQGRVVRKRSADVSTADAKNVQDFFGWSLACSEYVLLAFAVYEVLMTT
jgi:hypothetical protein